MSLIDKLILAIYLLTMIITRPAAALTCNQIFEGLNRKSYIERTAIQSRSKVIRQTLLTGATLLQLGTPTMLRGIKIKDIFWVRSGNFLRGTRTAYAEGFSPWGKIEILTQSGAASSLSVSIYPMIGSTPLPQKNINILKELYPSLRVTTAGHSSLVFSEGNEVIPQKIVLRLDREEMAPGESFEKSSRSLVSTIFNDPYGLMNLKPKKVIARYKLPRKLYTEPFFRNNLDFFGNFGPFSRTNNSSWSAYNQRDKMGNHLLKDTGIHIELRTQSMSFWLENSFYFDAAIANVRRIVWSLLELGYDQNGGDSPTAKISGVNGVSVEGLNFDTSSLNLVKIMNFTQNHPKFETPLQGLTEGQKQFVREWLLQNMNLSESRHDMIIRLEDIVFLE